MAWSIRRWRPRHLLLAWVTYWVGLFAVTLGPAIPPIIRATSENAKGSINASYGDQGLNLTVLADGATAWSGTASLTAIGFWLIGPPLLLWLVWFVRRRPRDAEQTSQALDPPNAKAVAEGAAKPVDINKPTSARVKR